MCGISGIINTGSGKYGIAEIKAMTDMVKHRGPDDAGYLLVAENNTISSVGDTDTPAEVYITNTPYKPAINIADTVKNSYTAALGHRRLAILDLSPYGHCPMSYCNGRYWITFNGEIYNFNELKTELISKGHQFISHTDTEVILAAYAEWGVTCLQRFHGMWAFAIYDIQQQEIFLARDRFGIKPLYYWMSPEKSFCFASEVKQFTVLPGWQAILNNQRAFDYLVYNMTDHTDETMFRGVYHVTAGHYLKCPMSTIAVTGAGRVKLTKWYQPEYTGTAISFDEAAVNFEKYFKASVKKHLVSDVPLGSALSGGLDSTAIVCEINNLLKGEGKNSKQQTFSYCSADERYNEKKWIEAVLQTVNVDAHYVEENEKSVTDTALNLIWYNDEPNQSQSELATYYIYQSAKEKNIKVLTNGQGADEYLSGYEAFSQFRWLQLLKKGKISRLNYEIDNNRSFTNYGRVGTYIRLCYFMVPNFVQKFFRRRTATYKAITSVIDTDTLKASDNHPYNDMEYNTGSVFNIAHRQMLNSPLPKYLRYEDRMSMANSVEARVPFLDHKLVEFTTQLPADYLDGLGEQKKILLYGLKNILPAAILSRKDKIGFATSEEKWVRQQMTAEFRQLLQDSINNSKGIIKPSALTYFDGVVSGTIPFSYTYWRLIAFGAWMKIFNVQIA
jgi:asparagine synthase (glutamine-hydrolysing)